MLEGERVRNMVEGCGVVKCKLCRVGKSQIDFDGEQSIGYYVVSLHSTVKGLST
jgi:hypothetical protein